MAAPVLTIPTTAIFDAELAARAALNGEAWWKIEVDTDVDGSYTDYTSSLDNNRVRIEASGSVFQEGLASAALFALRNVPKIADAGDWAGAPVKISVKLGAAEYIQVFAGYVDQAGVAREKRSATDDVITVSASDPSQSRGMAHTADVQTLYVGKYISKSTDATNSLAHILAGLLGLTPATDTDFQVGTALEVTKDYVYVDKGASYWHELQDLALAHNCLLGFRYDGKLRLARWTMAEWNAPASSYEYTFDSTNVHSFQAVGSGVLCTRAKIEYEQWQALAAGPIAKCMESYNESTRRNAITIAAGEYWPGGTDEYAVARLSYERGGEAFPIGVNIVTPTIVKLTSARKRTGVGTEIQYTGSGTLTLESFNGTAGTDSSKTSQHADASEIILKNTGASPVTISQLILYGVPIRVLSRTTVQHKIAGLDDWELVDKDIPGKYVTSRAQAETTCQRWTSFGQTPRQRFEAVCDFTPHLQPGAIVVFNPTTDISLYCMVEGYEHRSEGPHTLTRTVVTLVELADYTETAGDSDLTAVAPAGRVAGASTISGTDIDSSTLNAEQFAFASDGSAAVYDGYDALPSGAELFDLRQPDCLSHLGRAPTSREVVFEPGYLKDELGTEYANGWSKWTGLGVIGCFAAVTNLVVDPEDLSMSSWSESDVDAPTDSGYTLRGRKLWLIQNSSAAAGYEYQEITVTTAVHGIQAVIKKGTTNAPTLRAYDGATLRCQVDVDFSGATPTATASTGTLAFAKAIGTDAILVAAITTAFTGTTMSLRLYTGSADDNANVYATAFQVELRAYPTPYTPISRSAGGLDYPMAPATSGTIDLWLRPMFNYDTRSNLYGWVLGGVPGSIDGSVFLRYEQSTDKWMAAIYVDASNYRAVRSTSAFASNAALWAWQHIKVVYDIPNQEISLFVGGVEQTATASAGTVSSLAFAADAFLVGNAGCGQAYAIDGFLADLCYQASTEDETTTHYDTGMPWYDTAEVANAVQTVRINQAGIRMHNAAIAITDDYNRLIAISNKDGLLAKDAAGTVTHDIPTAPVLVGAYVQGHYYAFKFDNTAYTLLSTSSPTAGSWATGIQAVTGGNQVIRGARIRAAILGSGSGKVSVGVYIYLRPTGSSWGATWLDMASSGGYRVYHVATDLTGGNLLVVLDVPVNSAFQFDYYLDLTHTDTKTLTLQQLGVWI